MNGEIIFLFSSCKSRAALWYRYLLDGGSNVKTFASWGQELTLGVDIVIWVIIRGLLEFFSYFLDLFEWKFVFIFCSCKNSAALRFILLGG